MDDSKIITIDPAKRSGKACIRNPRITVYDVLDLAGGMTNEKILTDFPNPDRGRHSGLPCLRRGR